MTTSYELLRAFRADYDQNLNLKIKEVDLSRMLVGIGAPKHDLKAMLSNADAVREKYLFAVKKHHIHPDYNFLDLFPNRSDEFLFEFKNDLCKFNLFFLKKILISFLILAYSSFGTL